MRRTVFPRDESGRLVSKKACQTPGCKHPNWHVCLVGKPDLFPKLLKEEEKNPKKRAPREPGTNRGGGSRSAEHQEALNQANIERWNRHHERNRDRDRRIVARYAEGGIGYMKIAEEFGISKDIALRVLNQAAARGEISMRKRGTTIRNGAS